MGLSLLMARTFVSTDEDIYKDFEEVVNLLKMLMMDISTSDEIAQVNIILYSIWERIYAEFKLVFCDAVLLG